MHDKIVCLMLSCVVLVGPFMGGSARAADTGVHCQIDQTSFDGDADTTEIDYVVPPGGKPPHFRVLALHADDNAGSISVELKAKGVMVVGTTPLDQEPLWKSVIKLPKQRDSAITGGDFVLTHFEPAGDLYAAGTVSFQTADAHRGQCHFRLRMNVVDLGHTLQ